MKYAILVPDKFTLLLAKIGIIVAILIMITCGVCVGFFTLKSWRNSDKLVNAQVKEYEARAENVGKEQKVIYEQYYHSPSN